MSIDDMIEEAWLSTVARYTVSEYNLERVSYLGAKDFGDSHPEHDIFVPFIAGALYERYKNFTNAQKRGI